MIMKKPTKREQQSAAKRDLICKKALELFSVYGYDKTTLADISKVSGFSIGSLYNFFGTKENILLEISKRMSEVIFDLENVDQKAKEPYEHILTYLLRYSSCWEELGVDLTANIYRVYSKAYLNESSHSAKHLSSIDSFADFIKAAQQAGTFDMSMSAEDSAAYFITIGRGLVYEWCLFGGSYSLTEKAAWFLPRIIRTFIIS